MSDRLNGIFNFVQAAEAGSFALAAQRLGRSRSAVGKSVARLEEQLGVRLFHRTTRSQSLTHDGQIFYERCSRALAELASAELVLDSGRATPSGRLRMSVPVVLGRHCIAPLLVDVARRFPELKLEVSFSDRRIDLVEDGFDIAVHGRPVADTTALQSRRLGTQIMVLCAAPSYLAERGLPRRVADLAHHQAILCHHPLSSVPWRLLDAQDSPLDVTIGSRISFDDVEAITAAAIAGAGVALLPGWFVKEALRAGTLVRVLGTMAAGSHEIHAVWPATRHLASKVRVVIDELVARLPALLSPVPDGRDRPDESYAGRG